MATTARIKTWNSGDTLTASDLNAEFNNLLTGGINNIENANVSATAAIAATKIAGTAATQTGTETLTNKTLTTPIITNPSMDATNPDAQTYTPSSGGTATLDLSLANEHRITMPAGNITIALSNDTKAKKFIIDITQDSGGSRTVTWFSTIRWFTSGGTPPTLTTTGNKRDVFGFIRTGSGTYDGFIVGQGG